MSVRRQEGTLTLDIVGADGNVSRLRTIAPFEEHEVTSAPVYDEPTEIPFGPGWGWSPPRLRYVDLTVRVRLPADSTPDGTLHVIHMTGEPPARVVLEVRDERDDLKMLRETLAFAQGALAADFAEETHGADLADARLLMGDPEIGEVARRYSTATERLGRLIAEIDRQRPLGPDGKHGDLHTPTCGCEDR